MRHDDETSAPDPQGRTGFWILMVAWVVMALWLVLWALPHRHVPQLLPPVETSHEDQLPPPEILPPEERTAEREPEAPSNETENINKPPIAEAVEVILGEIKADAVKVFRPHIPVRKHAPHVLRIPALPSLPPLPPYAPDDYFPPHNQWGQL